MLEYLRVCLHCASSLYVIIYFVLSVTKGMIYWNLKIDYKPFVGPAFNIINPLYFLCDFFYKPKTLHPVTLRKQVLF